jgi:hypothetical protein
LEISTIGGLTSGSEFLGPNVVSRAQSLSTDEESIP